MYRLSSLCLIFLLLACGDEVESSKASTYLNEVLNIMEKHSINRYQIDWPEFRASVLSRAEGAQTIAETHDAIRHALVLLGDNHSFYEAVGGTILWGGSKRCWVTPPPTFTPPFDIGYVSVRAFSGSPAEARKFADDIQGRIRSQDSPSLKGWIVDLRHNRGGNMWPMLAGIGPVLGEGTCGHFIDPQGIASYWSYEDGSSKHDGVSVVTASNPYRLLIPAPKVAVLIDESTASSGEAIVIAFLGRPQTRTFGMTGTCGLSTANRDFLLSHKGTLYLTVSVMADRFKNKFGGSILPDSMIVGSPEDVVQSAIDWIHQ